MLMEKFLRPIVSVPDARLCLRPVEYEHKADLHKVLIICWNFEK